MDSEYFSFQAIFLKNYIKVLLMLSGVTTLTGLAFHMRPAHMVVI